MAYLYAGLGVVMLSGIMAIFEMGLAVTGQSLFRFQTQYHASGYLFSDNNLDDNRLMAEILNGAWKPSLLLANPGFEPSCADYPAPGNISWDPVSDSLCESYGDGRRILVDIVSDEVVYICFPKEPNSPCSFEEES